MPGGSNYDRHITVFSPEGKLHQIEYALKAVQTCGITGVALRGKDSVTMVIQKKVPDKLMDRAYVTNMYKVTPRIGCLAIGHGPDCKYAVQHCRQIAAEYESENGYEIPVHYLASLIGKRAQLFTQHAGVRPLAVTMLVCSIDDEKGAQLFKADPSGHYFGWKAAAIGAKDQEANNYLEKVVRKTQGAGSQKNTIQSAIDCLQVTLSEDMKANNIEVGVVTKDGFKFLSDAEVDQHLNEIAERDD